MSADLSVFIDAQGGEQRAELDVNISAPGENVLHVEITVLPDLSGYATKAYVDEAVKGGIVADETDPTVPAWAKQPEKPTYTAQEVGADAKGSATAEGAKALNAANAYTDRQIAAIPAPDVSGQIGQHNASEDAHPYIRELVKALADRLNALADSDDSTLDQLSEIVAYIKSNKGLIDAITTSKVSVGDIINNLTTNAAGKPLSAAQGVVLRTMIEAIIVPTALSQLTGDAAHRTVTDAEKAAWDAKSEFSGAYGDLTGKPTIPTVPTKVSAFQNDAGYLTAIPGEYVTEAELAAKGYLTEHQDISGKLDANKLPGAIEDALEQAKASGEFDGEDGQDGVSPTVSVSKSGKVTTISITDKNGTKTATVSDGSDGAAGAQGSPGKDGSNGKDGVSATHSWNGTVLTVTSASGTSSADLKGQKGDKGDKGDTGGTGPAGYTPKRGTDYWTDVDQEAIVQQVIAAIGTPVFGRVDADNNIILTGELAEGTYTIKYENADGTMQSIGDLVFAEGPAYTNMLNVYTVEWDKRWSTSSHATKDCLGAAVVKIPFADIKDKTVRFRPVASGRKTADGTYTAVIAYTNAMSYRGKAFKTSAGVETDTPVNAAGAVNEGNNTYAIAFNSTNFTYYASENMGIIVWQIVVNTTGTACSEAEKAACILTIDEEIVD